MNTDEREVSETAIKNKIRPDTILKTFWRDNEHFADLFNAALFGGEQVLKLPSDLGLVIGAITESQQLINHALESEQKGGQVNMCNALEELKLEGRLEGKQEGIEEGILANIRTCKNFNISKEDTIRNLMKEFSLSEPEAVSYMKKYW